jgi:hypothetical protein
MRCLGCLKLGQFLQERESPVQRGKGCGRDEDAGGHYDGGVQGVILLSAVLGVLGTVRSRQTMVILAGCLMILEVFLLVFSFWPLALLAGVGFLWTAYRMPG